MARETWISVAVECNAALLSDAVYEQTKHVRARRGVTLGDLNA